MYFLFEYERLPAIYVGKDSLSETSSWTNLSARHNDSYTMKCNVETFSCLCFVDGRCIQWIPGDDCCFVGTTQRISRCVGWFTISTDGCCFGGLCPSTIYIHVCAHKLICICTTCIIYNIICMAPSMSDYCVVLFSHQWSYRHQVQWDEKVSCHWKWDELITNITWICWVGYLLGVLRDH